MCKGHYEIKSHVYNLFKEDKKCTRSNDRLEKGLMYLYEAFQVDVINTSIVHTNISHDIDRPLLHIQSTFIIQRESHWTRFHSYDIIS